MSNINLIIPERAASIGSFMVGRLLPFIDKRMIGPFVFIDHMGPVHLDSRHSFDVLPHPHIGLSTLTYLFEGSIMHRDSLGNAVEIKPGAVNWMTAGKGIVHSERTPDYLRNTDALLHGLQIWVALPKDLEDMEPSFFHISADQIPTWTDSNLEFSLIAGEALGYKSPVPVYSKLYMIRILSKERQEVNLGDSLTQGESGMYILNGSISAEGNTYQPKQLLVAKNGSICSFIMEAGSEVYLFGGEPLPETRFIDWNFVATDKNIIATAKENWINQKFPKIPGDEMEFVPYPTIKKHQ